MAMVLMASNLWHAANTRPPGIFLLFQSIDQLNDRQIVINWFSFCYLWDLYESLLEKYHCAPYLLFNIFGQFVLKDCLIMSPLTKLWDTGQRTHRDYYGNH
jgi:hypothetical protein